MLNSNKHNEGNKAYRLIDLQPGEHPEADDRSPNRGTLLLRTQVDNLKKIWKQRVGISSERLTRNGEQLKRDQVTAGLIGEVATRVRTQ